MVGQQLWRRQFAIWIGANAALHRSVTGGRWRLDTQDLIATPKVTPLPRVEVKAAVAIRAKATLRQSCSPATNQVVVYVGNGIATETKGAGGVPALLPTAREGRRGVRTCRATHQLKRVRPPQRVAASIVDRHACLS